MRRLLSVVLAVGAGVWLSGPVFGQGQVSGDKDQIGHVALIHHPAVQKELKLNDKQVEMLKDIRQIIRNKLKDGLDEKNQTADKVQRREKSIDLRKRYFEEAQKAMQEILTPAQWKRFQQINLQQKFAQAFSEPEVEKALKLSQPQKERIRALVAEESQELIGINRDPKSRDEAAKLIGALHRQTLERIGTLLSADQRTQWKEMVGEPFELKVGVVIARKDGSPTTDRKPYEVATPASPDRTNLDWVEKRVQEWVPTAAERRFDEIGWAKGILEAERLAKEHGRPVFMFNLSGRLNVGRC
jgi:hypothetical protein